jgi:predicted NBD/HSP70 family sugar kinase
MKVLCFDIGGTNIKYGIIEDGVILEKFTTPDCVEVIAAPPLITVPSLLPVV